MPQTSQCQHMAIVESSVVQNIFEILTIELRIVAGARDRSYVRKPPNAMRLQHFEEFSNGAR